MTVRKKSRTTRRSRASAEPSSATRKRRPAKRKSAKRKKTSEKTPKKKRRTRRKQVTGERSQLLVNRITGGIRLPSNSALANLPTPLPPLVEDFSNGYLGKNDISEEETLRRKQKFVEAMAECGNVRASCVCAGVPRRLVMYWRKRDEEFSEAWDEAYYAAVDSLENEAWRRARDGKDVPVIYRGEITDSYKDYSDSLMMFLLKGHRSATPSDHPGASFRERTEHSGSIERPTTMDEETRESVVATILGMIESKPDPE